MPLNIQRVFEVNLSGNENLLKSYISNYGPVTVAVYVPNTGYFQNYKGGIFYDPTCPGTTNRCSSVNHGKEKKNH